MPEYRPRTGYKNPEGKAALPSGKGVVAMLLLALALGGAGGLAVGFFLGYCRKAIETDAFLERHAR